MKPFELKAHSFQIADTGDYDGFYEITNGDVSICTKDEGGDENEALEAIVKALNDSGCKFEYTHDYKFEIHMLREEIKQLNHMVENKLSWKDLENNFL